MKTMKQEEHTVAPTFLEETGVVTATGAAVSPEPTEGGPPSSDSSICSMSGFILGNSGDGAWNITWAVAGLTTKF